jgi:hypothetical protein
VPATALEEQAMKETHAELRWVWDKAMQAELKMEQERARSAASSNAYVPGDEQLCELLYGREVAVCDRAALQRLAEGKAKGRVIRRPGGRRPTMAIPVWLWAGFARAAASIPPTGRARLASSLNYCMVKVTDWLQVEKSNEVSVAVQVAKVPP